MINPLVSHIISFLIGSIPIGYVLAKIRGIDIRSTGSGNIGATNVARVLGKKSGVITLIFDALKGVLGCYYIAIFSDIEITQAVIATHGIAAVLGHCYSPFIGFRGGKGVATSLGVLLVLSPAATVIVLACFALVLKSSGYVSLASVSGALSFPVGVWAINRGNPDKIVFLVSLLLALVIVIRHEQNLKRLISGEEKKFISTKFKK